jgi:trimethylamine--corrinoid protein Co-methyltransferase
MQHELLTGTQVEAVHEASLRLLDRVGLDVHDEAARDLLASAGARVDGRRVFLPAGLVEAQRAKAPERFTLHARNPEHDLVVGDRPLFAPANGPAFVMEMDGRRRDGTLADYERFVMLTERSPHLDLCSNIPVEPADVPEPLRPLRTTYACLTHTEKCFMGCCLGSEAAQDVLRMVGMVFGERDLASRPRVLSIPCSLTPLGWDERMLGALMTYARAGQPVMINSIAIQGATAPVTLSGALALQNAEILAGIVIAQLCREGTPVVYASGSSNVDMRTGAFCVGSPEMAVNNALAAQMARYYRIPSRGAGALTDAMRPDAQAGYESMMNLFSALQGGLHVVLHAVGALETLNSISYEKFLLDEEAVGMVKHIGRGVRVDEEALALETVREAGPGGSFLNATHTFVHFRDQLFFPQITRSRSYAAWRDGGRPTVVTEANRRCREILEGVRPVGLPPSVDRDLRSYLDARTGRLNRPRRRTA